MLSYLNHLQPNCTLFSYHSYQWQCYLIYSFWIIKNQKWEMFFETPSISNFDLQGQCEVRLLEYQNLCRIANIDVWLHWFNPECLIMYKSRLDVIIKVYVCIFHKALVHSNRSQECERSITSEMKLTCLQWWQWPQI